MLELEGTQVFMQILLDQFLLIILQKYSLTIIMERLMIVTNGGSLVMDGLQRISSRKLLLNQEFLKYGESL
jgi:hypothetical protein